MEKYLQEELNLRKFGKRNPKQAEAFKHIEVEFENDQKTIELIERQLKKNQEITDKMVWNKDFIFLNTNKVHILNSFDNRVVALQRDIENVHEETTRLQTIHNSTYLYFLQFTTRY